jgi:hypothetical protein
MTALRNPGQGSMAAIRNAGHESMVAIRNPEPEFRDVTRRLKRYFFAKRYLFRG